MVKVRRGRPLGLGLWTIIRLIKRQALIVRLDSLESHVCMAKSSVAETLST